MDADFFIVAAEAERGVEGGKVDVGAFDHEPDDEHGDGENDDEENAYGNIEGAFHEFRGAAHEGRSVN